MSCGSRLSYLDEIAWTWQDGRLLALCLCAIGLLGAFLNGLVLIGVGGNAKLGTTVNKLLIWICTIAILESFVGILVKALILAQVIQTTVHAKWNLIFCKIALALPFTFCNIILVFWSLISFYRLYLVKRAANRKSMKDGKRNHFNLSCAAAPDTFRPQTTLPLTGIFVGSSIGVFTAIFSDSFVLLRDCRGNCIDPDVKFEEWKTALAMLVSACTFHVPSSLCYLFIYFIVKRHQRDQKRARLARSVASSGAMAIRMTLLTSRKEAVQPRSQQSATEMHPLPENKDFEDSENIEEFTSQRSRTPTPKETLKRKMSSPLVLIRKVSNNLMQTLQVPERNNVKKRRKSATSMETSDMFDPSSGKHDNDLDIEVDNSTYVCHKEGEVPPFVKTKSLQNTPSQQQQVIAGQNLPKLCCFGERQADKMEVIVASTATAEATASGRQDHSATAASTFFLMPPSLTINGRSIETQLHEDTQRKVDYYEGNDRVLTPSRRRRRKSVTSRRRHEEGGERTSTGKYAISNGPPSSRKSSQCYDENPSSINAMNMRKKLMFKVQAKRRSRRRRNIISAKLSVVFILLSVLMGLLLHFGYVKVDTLLGTKGDTITLRAFINALAFDVVLIIISPLMLLYSSKDLRKAIKTKFIKQRRGTQ